MIETGVNPQGVSRRGAARIVAAGTLAATMMPMASAASAADGPAPAAPRGYAGKRIDLHQHYIPQVYRDALAANGMTLADGIPALPAWSEDAMIAMMDEMHIEHAVISVVSPGVNFGDNAASRKLARAVNEEGARLAAKHKGRIGFFAVTPLPDVEGAVEEVVYALDHLGATGIIFETNFNGMYLGNAQLAPVYAELDKRNAVLFTHPTSPILSCGCGVGHGGKLVQNVEIGLGLPNPVLEFMFETTRTITNMVLSGTFARYPNIQMLIPHGGAALPVLTSRIDIVASMLSHHQAAPMREALGKMHFDLAGMPIPETLQALLSVANPAHIHYGSDWPYTPAPAVQTLAALIEQSAQLSPKLLADIMYQNSVTLLGKHI